eukprot:scaffold3243_cov173-Ochromonas_danica.AAC.25
MVTSQVLREPHRVSISSWDFKAHLLAFFVSLFGYKVKLFATKDFMTGHLSVSYRFWGLPIDTNIGIVSGQKRYDTTPIPGPTHTAAVHSQMAKQPAQPKKANFQLLRSGTVGSQQQQTSKAGSDSDDDWRLTVHYLLAMHSICLHLPMALDKSEWKLATISFACRPNGFKARRLLPTLDQ